MKISFKSHTLVLLVGPTRCGKSTFAQKLRSTFILQTPVVILSSDDIRKELLVSTNYEAASLHNHSQPMLEVSKPAFEILMKKIEAYTSFPVNTNLIVVDTRGMDQAFRNEVSKIARSNGYRVDCVLFDYKLASDYLLRTKDFEKEVVQADVSRFRRKVMPEIRRRDFDQVIRIRSPHTVDDMEVELLPYKDGLQPFVTLGTNAALAVIGDSHECVDQLIELINKLPNDALIAHVGDYLDKGDNTARMLEYMTYRVFTAGDYVVTGNHEAYLYRRLKKEISPASKEVEETYFTALKVLEESEVHREMFFKLYEASVPFLYATWDMPEEGPQPHRQVYITHAPCENRFLGKDFPKAILAQRNLYIKDREADIRDEIKFLFDEASPIDPLHIFGHLAHAGPMAFRNKIFLDTGCVHGGKLSAAVIRNGRYEFVDVPGVAKAPKELPIDISMAKKEVKPFDIRDYNLSPEDSKFLSRTMKNGVRYISGTMAPAPSADGQLEPLSGAYDFFEKRGVKRVVLQPKYMGSRCQFYLDFENPENSKATSRNGYVIRHVDGLDELLKKWSESGQFSFRDTFFPEAKSVIIDGELRPWSALGQGLIDREFRTYEALVLNELTELDEDETFQGFDIAKDYDTKERLELLKVFQEQLELYGKPGELEFSPFNILAVDGVHTPSMPHYAFEINPDPQCVVDLDDPDSRAAGGEFFNRRTVAERMEGIVMKPICEDPIGNNIPEYMKVRNEDYLTLVYGYDYKLKYDKLVAEKNISSKVRISIEESKLASQMLAATDDERPEFIVKMIAQLKQEQMVDPRL